MVGSESELVFNLNFYNSKDDALLYHTLSLLKPVSRNTVSETSDVRALSTLYGSECSVRLWTPNFKSDGDISKSV